MSSLAINILQTMLSAMKKRKYNPHARSQRALSKTVKVIKSRIQIEHLDAFSKTHKHDVEKTREWMIKLAGRKLVSELSDKQVEEVLTKVGLGSTSDRSIHPMREVEMKFGISSDFEIRGNLCFENNKWVEKQGKDWLRFLGKIRQEESTYKMSDGNTYSSTDVVEDVDISGLSKEEAKDAIKAHQKKSKFKYTLEVMYVRTTPWLASQLNSGDSKMIKGAVTEFAKLFEVLTGYPVKAVNIHKESEHDVHLHICYSTVVKHYKKVSAAERRKLMKPIRDEVRKELKAAGKPSQPQYVAAEIKDRGLDLEVPEVKFDCYKKIMKFDKKSSDRNKNWPKARRAMYVLGAAYRYKGKVWEAASDPADKEAIRKFREKETTEEGGTFTDRLASVYHQAEDLYVDWWAESLFERLLLERMSDEQIKALEASKKQCVQNYVATGKTLAHPAEVHLESQKDEIKKKKVDLDKREEELISREAEAASKVSVATASEAEIRKREVKVELTKKSLKVREGKLEEFEKKLTSRELQLSDEKEDLSNREDQLLIDRAEVDNLKQETEELRKQATTDSNEASEILTKVNSDAESLKDEGRREILVEVAQVIAPSTGKSKDDFPSTASESDEVVEDPVEPPVSEMKEKLVNRVEKITAKASLWDQVKGDLKKLVSRKSLPKWMNVFVSKFKSVLGMDNTNYGNRE